MKFLISDWSTYLGLLRDNHLMRNAGLIIQNGSLFIGQIFWVGLQGVHSLLKLCSKKENSRTECALYVTIIMDLIEQKFLFKRPSVILSVIIWWVNAPPRKICTPPVRSKLSHPVAYECKTHSENTTKYKDYISIKSKGVGNS